MLKFLRTQNPPCPWHKNCCAFAVRNNNMEMLRFLREAESQPCSWDEKCCIEACKNNNIEMLLCLRKNKEYKCPLVAYCYEIAISKNNTEIIEVLKEEDCPWDEDCFVKAVEMNNLKMVEFFCSKIQKPKSKLFKSHEPCYEACVNNNLEMLQFLRLHNPPFNWGKNECLRVVLDEELKEWIMNN